MWLVEVEGMGVHRAAVNPDIGQGHIDWSIVPSTMYPEIILHRSKCPNTEKNNSKNLLLVSRWKEEYLISKGLEATKISFETEIIY